MSFTVNIPLDTSVDVLTVVIDEQQFEDALTDPAVRRLHQDADDFLATLQREGRDF